jgi:predicted O-methyltransferase YrrM
MIEGQLNDAERRILTDAVLNAPKKPQVVIEVGTWLGGGSTIHILRALELNDAGHLWGIEVDRSIYERMIANIRAAAPECVDRFTPLFGPSEQVIPKWLAEKKNGLQIDLVFLDGGNNPGEQIQEFHLLDEYIPVGGQLLSHDAKMRKGKWLVPYLSRLDNWQVRLVEGSDVGLMYARKTASQPSPAGLKTAQKHLFKLRCNPVEIAAAILPAALCGFVLRLLPGKLSRRLSDG